MRHHVLPSLVVLLTPLLSAFFHYGYADCYPLDKCGVLTGLGDGSTGTPVNHDPAGVITSIDGRNIYYDWLGRPVLVTNAVDGSPVVAYTYDAFGRLAKRTAVVCKTDPGRSGA